MGVLVLLASGQVSRQILSEFGWMGIESKGW